MKAKKVLFVSHTANFQKFNRPFMRWLKSNGYQVHYASSNEEVIYDADKVFAVKITRNPISLINLKAVGRLRKIIESEEYSLVHCHTPMGGVVARLASRRLRKKGMKVIYTAHGFHFYKGARLLNWLIYFPIELILSFVTDVIITVNDEDYLIADSHFHSFVFKINGVGVDLQKYAPVNAPKKRELRKSVGYNDNDFIGICVAEFTKNKNQAEIINAAIEVIKDNSNFKLIFAGVGDELLKCKALVEKAEINRNVTFLGYSAELPKFYAISDVLIASSLREGLPVNVVEAMAIGLPTVASRNRGHIELVDERNGFLYDAGDVARLSAILNELIKNRESLVDLSLNALEKSKLYSLENAVSSMAKIYEKVLNV